MSSITLDAAVVEKLRTADSHVELRDPQGKIIGFFRPLPRMYEKHEIPELSKEEIERRLNNPVRFTTEEVLKRLRELP